MGEECGQHFPPLPSAAWREALQGPVRSRAEERRFTGKEAGAKHKQASFLLPGPGVG